MKKYLLLCGGVGGAKLALGFKNTVNAENLGIAVNTGDDFTHLNLKICPDLDTVMYTILYVAKCPAGCPAGYIRLDVWPDVRPDILKNPWEFLRILANSNEFLLKIINFCTNSLNFFRMSMNFYRNS